jgi:hypothetical protein
MNKHYIILRFIVFKLGLVQGLGSRFWPGYPIARVNSDFFKIKRHRFSKKTNINGWQPSFWPSFAKLIYQVSWVTSNFDFFYFFKSDVISVSNQFISHFKIIDITVHIKSFGSNSQHRQSTAIITEYIKIHLHN